MQVAGDEGAPFRPLGRRAQPLAAAEPDPDMRSYAEAELDSLRAEQAAIGDQIRDVLYDRAAGADHASLILEVRAGTGGDEAALFARDLFEMYRRYAETKGWKFEPNFTP